MPRRAVRRTLRRASRRDLRARSRDDGRDPLPHRGRRGRAAARGRHQQRLGRDGRCATAASRRCSPATPRRRSRPCWSSAALLPAVDLLKVGHHGSTSSTDAGAARRDPPERRRHLRRATGNEYGHPAPETLATLAARPGIARVPDRSGRRRRGRHRWRGPTASGPMPAGARRARCTASGAAGSIGAWPFPTDPPPGACSTTPGCPTGSSSTPRASPASPLAGAGARGRGADPDRRRAGRGRRPAARHRQGRDPAQRRRARHRRRAAARGGGLPGARDAGRLPPDQLPARRRSLPARLAVGAGGRGRPARGPGVRDRRRAAGRHEAATSRARRADRGRAAPGTRPRGATWRRPSGCRSTTWWRACGPPGRPAHERAAAARSTATTGSGSTPPLRDFATRGRRDRPRRDRARALRRTRRPSTAPGSRPAR